MEKIFPHLEGKVIVLDSSLIKGLAEEIIQRYKEMEQNAQVEAKTSFQMNDWLSLKEVMSNLKVSKTTVRRYRIKGLKAYTKGRKVWFKRDDIEKWLTKK